MRSPMLVALTILCLTPIAVAGPVEDLDKELATLEARLIELTMSSLEARFAKPGGPILRLYDVADLTMKFTDFLAPNIQVRPAGSEFDEEQPQFGASIEGESFFSPDELTEILRSNVRPAVWDSGGILEVRESSLVVSAPAEIQDEIRTALGNLRTNLGRIVTVEIRALEVDLATLPVGPLSATECDALLTRLARGEGGRILVSTEVTGYAGQRLMAFDGRQRAFVQDHDVEVAQSAKVADPIVGVLQEGLSIAVRALPQGPGQGILLDIQADCTLPEEDIREVKTTVGAIQAPRNRHGRARATVTVAGGGGLVFGGGSSAGRGGGRIAFFARARSTRVVPLQSATGPDRATQLRRRIASRERLIRAYETAEAERGPLFRMQLYPVDDLVFRIRDYPGPSIGLVPSGAGGFREDDSGEDPIALFETDQLVDMIRSHVAPGSWDELLSTSIEMSGPNLVVVHTAGAHARVAEFLRQLRDHASRLIALDVEVIAISDADRRALGATRPFLDPESRKRLDGLIAAGRATRLHAGRILARSNQRVALVDLEPVSYVYDYDVEIAENAFIPDPLIQQIEQGLVVDVRPVVAGHGSHIVLECRMDRAILAEGEIPRFNTDVGAIETPTLSMTRLGCTLSIPVGTTAIVGGGLMPTGGEGRVPRCLLLVTPRILTAQPR